ncbi:hypothetical protein AA105894_0114 [Asaia spathodeae NBRC 105894]|nr:hypothetical protein AA105894_0114 [Asaia spathodeae NBRC 105894]
MTASSVSRRTSSDYSSACPDKKPRAHGITPSPLKCELIYQAESAAPESHTTLSGQIALKVWRISASNDAQKS